MTAFFTENKIFLMGVLLLGALVVGASQLQEMHDSNNGHGDESTVVTQSGSTSTPWQAPATTSASAQSTVTNNAPPKAASPDTVPPAPRRVYNREQDDD